MTGTRQVDDSYINRQSSNYRWVMLALATLTAFSVIAMPMMSLPVLFDEIAAELGLTLIQIGLIWGLSSLTGLFIGLIGGVLGDRFGTRRVLFVACVMVGVFGASRGLVVGFNSFIATSFLMGLFAPAIGVNIHKVAGEWFTRRQLGLANGAISAGFAGGFLTGSLLGASVLSPAFGGWRPVMFFYGGVAIIVGLLWLVFDPKKSDHEAAMASIPLREGLPKIVRLPNVWLIGLGKIGLWGCVRGFTGYLPLYLREVGWEPGRADAALAVFFTLSLLGAIPIPMWSDRLGLRKPFLLATALLIGSAVWLLGFAQGWVVIAAVILGGMTFDAFMAISITAVTEVKGVGPTLAGTALGFSFLIQEIGGMLSPPIGNSLAAISPQAPFYFWGTLALLGGIAFYLIQVEEDHGEFVTLIGQTEPVP